MAAKRGFTQTQTQNDEESMVSSKKICLEVKFEKKEDMYEDYSKINPYAIDMTISDWSCKRCSKFVNECHCSWVTSPRHFQCPTHPN